MLENERFLRKFESKDNGEFSGLSGGYVNKKVNSVLDKNELGIERKRVKEAIVENGRGYFFQFLYDTEKNKKISYKELISYIIDNNGHPNCYTTGHHYNEDSFNYLVELEEIAKNNDIELYDDYFVLLDSYNRLKYIH